MTQHHAQIMSKTEAAIGHRLEEVQCGRRTQFCGCDRHFCPVRELAVEHKTFIKFWA
jgi:hypothetical protein